MLLILPISRPFVESATQNILLFVCAEPVQHAGMRWYGRNHPDKLSAGKTIEDIRLCKTCMIGIQFAFERLRDPALDVTDATPRLAPDAQLQLALVPSVSMKIQTPGKKTQVYLYPCM